ncbi:MAG: TIM barrel protein [Anaerolineae bacterium]|nr:TIM barrel protein [Anaerolineae bacterium]
MKDWIVACSTITWGRDTPREQMLSEIAEAGYEGAPAGAYLGTPGEVLALYGKYGLKPGPGYLGADFEKPEQEAAILERARSMALFSREIGCTELYVAAGGFDSYVTRRGLTRRRISAKVKPEDMMSDAEFQQFAKTLNKAGEITLKEGVKSCFHNHVGSTIETRVEIDKLFALVDPALVFQGPDIGHLAWAGEDPVQFCRDYASQIVSLHVKDIDPKVLKQGLAEDWGYGEFSDNGIFAELGEGMVDFPAMFEVLKQAGYKGWIIIETDCTTKPTPLDSAKISRAYLRSIGL